MMPIFTRSTICFTLLVLSLGLTACGGTGAGTSEPTATTSPTPPPPAPPPPGSSADTTPPIGFITTPVNGATVSNAITITATAADPNVAGQTTSGMTGVQFRVDGANVGAEDTTTPYSVTWNTPSVTNGTHKLTAVARDKAGNKTTSTEITVTVNNAAPPPPPPPPPPPGGGISVPSLEDERNTYIKWGWTWNASVESSAVTEPTPGYQVYDPAIHDETEGDDLWSYLTMYQRTGNIVYFNRAQAWARYFKYDYRNSVGTPSNTFNADRGFGLDHLYGWGLVAWYEHTGDADALAEAENIAAELENYWSDPKYVPGNESMAYYGLRQGGRHLLLVTRVAEATKKQRWITLRDKLIDLWLQSPDWNSTYGMYFVGDYETDKKAGSGKYAAGLRIQSPFQIGILSEAFSHAYRVTGRTALRDRVIAMARYVDQYGMDPYYQYSGNMFGVFNGVIWHRDSSSCGTGCSFWDPVYTTSLVNTLVLGYKYSGDMALYDRAKHFYNRGTKGIYGEPVKRAAADNVVHHFVDSIFSSSSGRFYLDYNKGELQYTYLIFENGGQ